MFNVTAIDELAKRLSDLVPAGARQAHDELLTNFRDTLRAGLRKFDLVTRDEFDVQRCVLLRTREKVEALESRVAELETLVSGPKSAN
jgi:BMFP domain-containing protein YqiC